MKVRVPSKTYTGRAHPRTSRQAAVQARKHAGSDAERIYQYALSVGSHGFTDDEAAEALEQHYGRDISANQAAARRLSLAEAGLVVRTKRKRTTRRGGTATVWVTPEHIRVRKP